MTASSASAMRVEDDPLLRGAGCYTDDLSLPGQTHACVLRSPHAHARITGLDTAAARAMPGVLAVLTHADLAAAGIGRLPSLPPLKSRDGSERREPPRHALARDTVRHVGDPVAFVVAETAAQARDACERVMIGYQALPAVSDGRAALAAGAPQLGADIPGNCAFDWETGDAARTAALFRGAQHVVSLTAHNQRLVGSPMETRAVNAVFDPLSARFTVYAACQGVHMLRSLLAQAFALPAEHFHVITRDVGGGFGPKFYFYPEQILCALAARQLGRPVKWSAERSETFVSDSQARDQHATLELALDAEGRMLALRMDAVANLGAYLSTFAPVIPASVATAVLPSVYRIEAVHARVRGAITNTVPVDAYRGSGKPEIHFLVERLVDRAARVLHIDRIELRRRNLIPASAMPWRNALGVTYDSGDFPAMMDHALAAADWAGAPGRKVAAQQRGKLHGIGLACYVESTGGARVERAEIRMDAKGQVSVICGTQSSGQGHVTAYRALVAARLQLAPASVLVVQGDSDQAPSGGGTGGSRSLSIQGTALVAAMAALMARGRAAAAEVFGAAAGVTAAADGRSDVAADGASDVAADGASDVAAGGASDAAAGGVSDLAADAISFEDGCFCAGTQRISWADLAYRSGGLSALAQIENPIPNFPNGCHVAEVEIDPDTGQVSLARYTVADDFGKVLHPAIVEGQVHGGVAQGIGAALLEAALYDAEGQLLSGSFMDYAMPRAQHMAPFAVSFHAHPCTTNPLGVKGAGEAGSVGAPAAVINAVVDALSVYGIDHIEMPATPARVWRAMQGVTAHHHHRRSIPYPAPHQIDPRSCP